MQDFVQDLRRAYRREILLGVAIAAVVERAKDRHAGGGRIQSNGRRRAVDSADIQRYLAIFCRDARGGTARVNNVITAGGIRIIIVADMNAIAEFRKRAVKKAGGVSAAERQVAVVAGARSDLEVAGECGSPRGHRSQQP